MDVPVPQVLATVYPDARESEPRLDLARVPMTCIQLQVGSVHGLSRDCSKSVNVPAHQTLKEIVP